MHDMKQENMPKREERMRDLEWMCKRTKGTRPKEDSREARAQETERR
jgi:hypothetical protein